MFVQNSVIIGLIHIDMMRYNLIGATLEEDISDSFKFGRIWKEKFVMLYVFVERE